jgi:pimeloyl-ACP methyl ester carboxylesterase
MELYPSDLSELLANYHLTTMEVKMNFKRLLTHCLIALFVLALYGCSNGVENVALSSDGVEISFLNQGKGNPAILFVHGWANNNTIWEYQVAHFSEKYKVVAVDLPGFGASGTNRSEWTMSSYGKDITEVIKKLRLKEVILVGFSMGAPVVVEAAVMNPDVVKGLVIVNDMHNVNMEYTPEIIAYMEEMMMDVVKNPAVEKLGYFFRTNVDENYQKVLAMIADSPMIGWEESLQALFQWINEDCKVLLPKVKAPIVAVNSGQEPTDVDAFKAYVPTFKAKIIPDVGHVVMWDATDEFNRLLEETIQEFLME